MKDMLKDILGGLVLFGLGTYVYKRGRRDQARDFNYQINKILADERLEELKKETENKES